MCSKAAIDDIWSESGFANILEQYDQIEADSEARACKRWGHRLHFNPSCYQPETGINLDTGTTKPEFVDGIDSPLSRVLEKNAVMRCCGFRILFSRIDALNKQYK